MKNGTKSFYEAELHDMETNASQKGTEIGKSVPYHLQYIRDGKVNVKPEEGLDGFKRTVSK